MVVDGFVVEAEFIFTNFLIADDDDDGGAVSF